MNLEEFSCVKICQELKFLFHIQFYFLDYLKLKKNFNFFLHAKEVKLLDKSLFVSKYLGLHLNPQYNIVKK